MPTRRERAACAALVALLGAAACGPAPTVKPSTKPSVAGPKIAKTPVAQGSAKPSATPSAAPSAAASALAPPPAGTLLKRPAAGTIALSGRVMIDASYALAQGGTIISDQGGAIISDNGGGILSNNGGAIAMGGAKVAGGQLVSNNGGAVALSGSGNLVAPGGAGVVAEIAGGLLLANNGAGIISDNGGGILSNNGGAYRLAQAAPAPRPGFVAPAAGMLVSVVSLRDRKYLPVGQDAAGKDVFGLYTNGQGGYEVFLPAAEAGNVLVVASAPGAPDPRLALNVIAPNAAATASSVDELGATTSRYLRRGLVGRMGDTLINPAFTTQMLQVEPTTSGSGKAVLTQLFQALGEGAARAGLDASVDRAIVDKRAQRIVDIGLADADLAAVMMDADSIAGWQGPPRPAMAALRQRTGELLDGTADRLAADPDYFKDPFLPDVMNAPFTPGGSVPPLVGTYQIRKPSDFTEFMLAEYFGVVRFGAETAFQRAFRVAFGVPAPRDPDPDAAREAKVQAANTELRGAIASVFVALAKRLTQDPKLVDKIEATLREPLP